MLSLLVCPKVITLSGFYCTKIMHLKVVREKLILIRGQISEFITALSRNLVFAFTSVRNRASRKKDCKRCGQAFAQSNFFGLSIQSKSNTKMWFKIQIQIHFLKWIDNPIQIQSQSNYLRKNERQQTLKVFCLNVLDMEFPRDIFLSTNLLNARQMLIRNSLALLLEQD